MRPFVRWGSMLGLAATAVALAPNWRTDEFLELKRVRVCSVGALHEPGLIVREVQAPAARGAAERTRLRRCVAWEPFGSPAIALFTGCGLLGAALIARSRSKPARVGAKRELVPRRERAVPTRAEE